MDWKGVVGAVAPVLATALGGPLAGVAVRAIGQAVLGRDDATESEISAVVAGATPEQLALLRKADSDFRARMRELDIDVERIAAADRASARAREAAVKDWVPQALAMIVTAGFLAVLAYLLAHGKPETGGDALLVMLGSLGTAWTAIITYYYGSSAGSAAKSALLERKAAGDGRMG